LPGPQLHGVTQMLRPLFYASAMTSKPGVVTRTIAASTAAGAAALALALTLAGCAPATNASAPASGSSPAAANGSSGSSGSAKEIDACSLLTAPKASALVNETLSAGVSSTIAPGQDQCKYGSTGADIGLNVIVYHGDSAPTFSTVVSATGANKPVSGVGTKADDDGSIELDVELANQDVVAVQYEQAAGRLAVAKAVVAALK
jgi:hypothetical protein